MTMPPDSRDLPQPGSHPRVPNCAFRLHRRVRPSLRRRRQRQFQIRHQRMARSPLRLLKKSALRCQQPACDPQRSADANPVRSVSGERSVGTGSFFFSNFEQTRRNAAGFVAISPANVAAINAVLAVTPGYGGTAHRHRTILDRLGHEQLLRPLRSRVQRNAESVRSLHAL